MPEAATAPTDDAPDRRVSVTLDPQITAVFEEWRKRRGLSRSSAARQLLYLGLEPGSQPPPPLKPTGRPRKTSR